MTAPSFWVGVVSRSHVFLGVEGGFIQLNHGKKAPLAKFKAGDGLVMYSPRTAYPDGEVLQAFTAIGRIRSGEIYQVEMAPDFKPYRIDVEFFACEEAPIRPLIDELSFIRSKTHWGAAFRFGQVTIPADDFRRIAAAMECDEFAGGGATVVRAERPRDLAAIRTVLAAGFSTDAEARLVDLLRDAGRLTVSLVAEEAGDIVGRVAFSPVSVGLEGGTGSSAAAGAEWASGVGLAPLAVAESHRGQGVGAALVRAGLEACRAAGIGWVVALGDPAYYGRFGFLPAADAGLHDEYGGGPAFQALELRSGALPTGAGLVRYSREFATVG